MVEEMLAARGICVTYETVRQWGKKFGRSCHENLALAKRKSEGLGSSSGRSRCPPILERFASEGAEGLAGNKIALNAECIVDGGLNGQEALR